MIDINIEDVTNGNGTGTFDILMASMNLHIKSQYDANRITGTDYATVYLGSMQAALAQSVQFALQQEVSNEQAKTAYTDRVLKDKQVAKLGLDNVMKQSETARDADPSFVYTPNYEEV